MSGYWNPSYAIERSDGSAYVYLPAHPRTFRCVARTVEVVPGVLLDLDASGNVIGVDVPRSGLTKGEQE